MIFGKDTGTRLENAPHSGGTYELIRFEME
jgi:hypothetical protein